jgi:hypothetical protein
MAETLALFPDAFDRARPRLTQQRAAARFLRPDDVLPGPEPARVDCCQTCAHYGPALQTPWRGYCAWKRRETFDGMGRACVGRTRRDSR